MANNEFTRPCSLVSTTIDLDSRARSFIICRSLGCSSSTACATAAAVAGFTSSATFSSSPQRLLRRARATWLSSGHVKGAELCNRQRQRSESLGSISDVKSRLTDGKNTDVVL